MGGDRIRVGLIGASPTRGWARDTHIPVLKYLEQYELAALATSSEESAAAAGRAFGVERSFGDYRRLLDLRDIDLVVVSVRTPMHFELAAAAIDAGKHVACEWPLGRTSAEAEGLRSAAEAKGVLHMVGMQGRGSPALNYVRDLVANGEIGRVLAATLTQSLWVWGRPVTRDNLYLIDARNGATALTISTSQAFDALCFCVGEIRSVSAIVKATRRTTTLAETGEPAALSSPDQVAIMGVMDNGGVASLHVKAGTQNPLGCRLEINGDGGDLLIESNPGDPAVGIHRANLSIRIARGVEGHYELMPIPPSYFLIPPAAFSNPAYNVGQLYCRFADAFGTGASPEPNFATAARRRAALDVIQSASDTGAAQSL
jgi:predicted dehydrogenase